MDLNTKNIVDDNGGLNRFSKFLKDNQSKIQSQNTEIDRLTKQSDDLINSRKNAYVSYKELTGE